MSCADGEAAPEMHDGGIVANSDKVDQLVLELGITVNRCMDGRMEIDDRLDTTHIVAETIHERRIRMEQRPKTLMS